MHEIESIAHYYQRKLIGKFRFFQEVLDALRTVAIGLSTDTFHLLDLTGLASRLDVLKVYLLVLGEVNDGAEEVKQSCKAKNPNSTTDSVNNAVIYLRSS